MWTHIFLNSILMYLDPSRAGPEILQEPPLLAWINLNPSMEK